MPTYGYTTARLNIPKGTDTLLIVTEDETFNTIGTLYYKVDTVAPTYNTNTSPTTYGFTALVTSTINVSNNNYVTFSVEGKNITTGSSLVKVISINSNFTVLGTFTAIINTTGADPTPTPTPNWSDISYNYVDVVWDANSVYLTGFTVNPITLSVTIQNVSGLTPELFYYVGNSDPLTTFYDSSQDPVSNGFTKINNLGTFTVAPNQYVAFVPNTPGITSGQGTVTVRNVTDANIVLDSFDIFATSI